MLSTFKHPECIIWCMKRGEVELTLITLICMQSTVLKKEMIDTPVAVI